jgi:hypothetical protein
VTPAQPTGSNPTGPAIAPVAPGRLGEAAPVAALSSYLDALGDWTRRRKSELDRIDAASLRANDPDAYTSDVLLSMALWQSVSDREAALLRTWDSGRADLTGREKMSQLIWGRLDSGSAGGPAGAAAGGLSLSLVESCRLSDALVLQLGTRLSFDPSAADGPARVAALRAALERLRELVKQEPSWGPQIDTLQARVDDVATRAARGGDVDGVLKQLEADAARGERDLIVTTATRKEAGREKVRSAERAARERQAAAEKLAADLRSAADRLAALQIREDAARALVARCVAEIARAPRFAVPEPDVLGPVPAERAALDAYLARVSDVERAMAYVEAAYAAPLAARDEMRGRFDAYRVMARRTGRDTDPEVAAMIERVRAALTALPCDVPAAEALLEQYTRSVRPGAAATSALPATPTAPTVHTTSNPIPTTSPGVTR